MAGAALLGTAGCGVFSGGQQSGNGGNGGGGGKKVLNTYYNADISDLVSTTTTDSYSFEVIYNVNEGLYRLDENEKPIPAMAESSEMSDDGLEYTFTLRDGIKWSNGDPVTSKDFKYAWLRAINGKTGGSYSFIVADYIKGGNEYGSGDAGEDQVAIETPDDKTLKVTLTDPTPFFLGLTAFPTYYPLNQKFLESKGDKFGLGADSLLYNGPYKLTKFDAANQAVLQKYEDYWDAKNVDLDEVNIRVVKDNQTALNLYKSGDLDIVVLVAQNVNQYKDSKEFDTVPEFWTSFLYLNHDDPVLGNENIRRAIMTGFDRSAITDKLLNDGSKPATGFVPDGMAGPGDQTFREAAGDTAPEFDPDEAKKLYQKGLQEIGKEPTLEITGNDDNTSKNISTFLKDQFEKNLGAKVNINTQPFDALLEATESGKYQIAALSWIADYNDPMTYMDLWLSDSDFNDLNYKSDRYDQLINGAKEESNPKKRMDMMIEAEKLLLEKDAALAPLYFKATARLVKPYVKNAISHPYGAPYLLPRGCLPGVRGWVGLRRTASYRSLRGRRSCVVRRPSRGARPRAGPDKDMAPYARRRSPRSAVPGGRHQLPDRPLALALASL